MENFIVSARKYRPVTFDSVVGQKSITNTLKNAIRNNQIAQAFLFTGPRGVGKTTCARILAKTINCENITENVEPCNTCESCVSFNKSQSFNIHELDAASNNSVDDIRALVDQVRFAPQIGKYSIYIIDEVHMLSAAAFNAFLKTLEEPPAHAKFILATTERHKIIPTILSRCQIFDFKRITIEDIASHLAYVAKSENINAEVDALHIIAQKADGALRDALSIFDQVSSFCNGNITYQSVIENLNVLDYDYYFKVINYISSGDIKSTLLILDEIIDKGFEAHHFITGLSEHIRNLLVCKDPETIKLLEVGANIRDKYKEQSSNCTYQMLLKALDISSKCDLQYKNVTNKRIHLELSMLQMCYINNGLNNIIQAEEAPKVPAAQNNPAVQNQMPPKVSASVPVNNPLPPSAAPKPATIVNQTSAQPPVRQASFNSAPQKSVSISGFIKSNPTQKEQENLPKPDKLTTAFTAEMLEQRWKEYAESISQDSPSFSSTLLNSKPQLKGNFNIGVCVENLVQQDEFNEKKVDLLGYLKEKLKNTEITITAEVKHVEVTERLYNPKDKFNKLAEKNPNVNDLRNKLELDYEY